MFLSCTIVHYSWNRPCSAALYLTQKNSKIQGSQVSSQGHKTERAGSKTKALDLWDSLLSFSTSLGTRDTTQSKGETALALTNIINSISTDRLKIPTPAFPKFSSRKCRFYGISVDVIWKGHSDPHMNNLFEPIREYFCLTQCS